MKVIKSSPEGTPEHDILYVIEYPSVQRVKMKKKDVLDELNYIQEHKANLDKRKKELEEIKKLMT